MMQRAYPLASAIVAYAARLRHLNKDLIAQAKFSVTYLEDLSKTQCATECDPRPPVSYRQCRKHCTIRCYRFKHYRHSNFGYSLYGPAINDSRAAIVSRSSAIKQADLNLKDIMENLLALQLDTNGKHTAFKNSEWWGQYHQSREIIDLGKTFTKLRATTQDEQGKPIKGAVVSHLRKYHKVAKKTDAAGKVSIVKIKPGNYNIKVESKDYITQTEIDAHFLPVPKKPFVHPQIKLRPSGFHGAGIQRFRQWIIPFFLSIFQPHPVELPISTILAKNGNPVLFRCRPSRHLHGRLRLNMGVAYQGSFEGLGLN